MKVRILRQSGPYGKPYWQTFNYDGDSNASVAAILDNINYSDDIVDSEGNPTDRISWECSCLQGMCGACAMVINGVPRLACDTFAKDLKGDVITIEPLKKFPVISDLVVDRGIIQENLKKVDAHIGEYHQEEERDHELEYQIGRCLKCGLCLEACPNYVKGNNFFGPLFANDSYFVASRSRDNGDQIKKDYKKHFAKGCSKSLACTKVCPMNIPTLASMAKMNRGF
ncbi:succinate dehydrogenase / fumarate reductase iron-sulfur subunit [Ruminococcaceae bacterium YRB3002]|nr:succinate dehydrogenase / fumarate reductase iron-sulfur subunit [Ruminococcaceae bacterium YRB3002]